MRSVLAAIPLVALASAAFASAEPPILLTINPEARVGVVMAGALPPAAACGSALELQVKVVNQGFVTASLEAVLVGNSPAAVTLSLDAKPLKGVPEELRVLRVTLMHPGQTDLTVAFRAHNDTGDLGGRDRVHFLVECRQQSD